MNVGINASNVDVIEDCGRYPMFIETRRKAVKYRLKIFKLSDEKYVKKCYKMLYYFDNLGHRNWVISIKNILYTYGLAYIWEMQMVTNDTCFLRELVQIMKDQFLVEWKDGINSNRKLSNYVNFKTHFGCELIYKFKIKNSHLYL